MTENKSLRINEGLDLVNKAKENEKKGKYLEAAREYKAAKKIFEKCEEKTLYAKCLTGHYASMLRYYLAGRNIEALANDMIEKYINNIVGGIKKAGLEKIVEYDLLISAYRELEKIFDENNMDYRANDMYYEKSRLYHIYFWKRARQKDRKRSLKVNDSFKSFLNLVFYWYCGHGERPLKALYISIFSIFLFSGIFSIFGLIEYSPPSDKQICYFQSLYFSIVTFTTLGFGDILPKDWIGQLFVALEVLFGYLMLGTLVAIIIRKITR